MRRFFVLSLYLVMAAAACLTGWRFAAGPFRFFDITVQSPVNITAVSALTWIALAFLNARSDSGIPSARTTPRWMAMALLTVITLAAFAPNLASPFVYDDYRHVREAAHAGARILVDSFRRVPGGHGLFFRPIAFISYWADYQWAGAESWRWHLRSLLIHALNASLLFFLASRLGMRRLGAGCAALVFALHGSRAETVAWTDARSDLLATFFCLAALLATVAFARRGRSAYLLAMSACAALGVYTKESAFCLPLLALSLLPFLKTGDRPRIIRSSMVLSVLCGVAFAYRWWALGGLGGYADRTGVSAVWHSSPLHTTEALLYRQWGFLFFPVNWMLPIEWWLCAAAAIFLTAMIACAKRSRAVRSHLAAAIAFVIAACLPVQHLLGFQADLAGSRVHYLPVAGLAIFWGVILEGIAGWGKRTLYAAALVAFSVASLEHNLAPWRTTPAAAAAICRDFGEQMKHDARPAVVRALPDRKDGVYFLGNGFAECVEMNSGAAMDRVYVDGRTPGNPPPEARHFVWNPAQGRIEERSY